MDLRRGHDQLACVHVLNVQLETAAACESNFELEIFKFFHERRDQINIVLVETIESIKSKSVP